MAKIQLFLNPQKFSSFFLSLTLKKIAPWTGWTGWTNWTDWTGWTGRVCHNSVMAHPLCKSTA